MGAVQDDRFDRGGPPERGDRPADFFWSRPPHLDSNRLIDPSLDFAPKPTRFGTANPRAEESVS